MSQCKTKTITFKTILRAKAFNQGFYDAHEGKPFNYDVPEADEWHYIRGRHFAQIFTGSIKSGRQIRYEALYEFATAWNSGLII
jgi:hypothetical protein